MLNIAPPSPTRPPVRSPPAERENQAPELSAELAAAVGAVTGETAMIPGTTAAPFITAMQKAALAQAQKRERRIRWAKRGAIAFVAALALHLFITRIWYRSPTDELLEREGNQLADTMLGLHSSHTQPLRIDRVVVREVDRVDASRIRYTADVTLSLRASLYTPAVTNGTAEYRTMQQSLQLARQRDLKLKLLPSDTLPPQLPLLLQLSHRAGETILAHVPFEARRFGWRWRIPPPSLALHTTSRGFEGMTLDQFTRAPFLIFNSEHLVEMRARVRAARDYIRAVALEFQKQGGDNLMVEEPVATPAEIMAGREAVDPNAVAEPAAPVITVPTPDARALDSANRPAVDPSASATIVVPRPNGMKPAEAADAANRPAFDPNAPAAPGTRPRAIEPVPPPATDEADRPAVDPNAPAIAVPSPQRPNGRN
jgi:hypothetical protein